MVKLIRHHGEDIVRHVRNELRAKIILKIQLIENKEVTLFVQLNW